MIETKNSLINEIYKNKNNTILKNQLKRLSKQDLKGLRDVNKRLFNDLRITLRNRGIKVPKTKADILIKYIKPILNKKRRHQNRQRKIATAQREINETNNIKKHHIELINEHKKEKEKKKELKNEDIIRKIIKEYTNKNLPLGVDSKIEDILPFAKKIKLNKLIDIILKEVRDQPSNDFYVLTVAANGSDEYLTLTNTNKKTIMEGLNDAQLQKVSQIDSYAAYDIIIKGDITKLLLERIRERPMRDAGAFFDMYHTTELDLTKFGIIKEGNEIIENHCIIDSLHQLGCSEMILDDLRINITSSHLPKYAIKKIAEKYDIYITVKSPKNKHRTSYGNKQREIDGTLIDNPMYDLGIVNKHYFPIMKVHMTQYALDNYHELMKEENNIDYISRIYGKRANGHYKMIGSKIKLEDSNRYITSYELINYMYNHKDLFLKPITNCYAIMESIIYNKVNHYLNNLEYTEKETKETYNKFIKEIGKEKSDYDKQLEKLNDYDVAHCDYETLNEIINGKIIQKEDCICVDLRNSKGELIYKKRYVGSYCSKNMLNGLRSNTQIFFHNASYDYTFLQKHLYSDQCVTKGKRLIQGGYLFTNYNKKKTIKIQINDTYAMINSPLKDFGKLFKLKVSKAEISHKYYNDLVTEKIIKNKYQEINKACTYFEVEADKMEFLNNIKEWNLMNPNNEDQFDAMEYRYRYCELDVEVQRQGYDIFSKYIETICKLNVRAFPTLASLADSHLIKDGCYDGVQSLSGVPREFIQKCVVGGRTMSRENKKYHIRNKKLNDFDAVSLYPSAMYRMKGFLKGKPKVIKNNNFEHYDGYFVEIIIKSVGIKRSFPLMSYVDELTTTRNWTNEMIGKRMYVDKTTLEDLIVFHKITYEFVKGYYFDEGHNSKINETMKKLFETRSREKELGNTIEVVYKLLMNSAYGKSLLTPIDTETKIFKNKEEAFNHMAYNYNSVISANSIHGTNKVMVNVKKPINEHFNRVHCGCEVLSMSKRIMNEVMCTAEDNGLVIYYQDTDSMHLEDSSINKLSKIYYEKYGRELIGKNMGQFHSDFKLNGNDKNIISLELLVGGKKCYIDRLQNTESKEEGYHIRMKGVSNKAFKHACEVNKCNPIELFTRLLNNEVITFDLGCGGKQGLLKYCSDLTYESITLFNREISFKGNYYDENNNCIIPNEILKNKKVSNIKKLVAKETKLMIKQKQPIKTRYQKDKKVKMTQKEMYKNRIQDEKTKRLQTAIKDLKECKKIKKCEGYDLFNEQRMAECKRVKEINKLK